MKENEQSSIKQQKIYQKTRNEPELVQTKDDIDRDFNLNQCDLIVAQSSFTNATTINLQYAHKISKVEQERIIINNRCMSGFVSIIGNESIQFTDPITNENAIFENCNRNITDTDGSCMIMDIIKFRHPEIGNRKSDTQSAIDTNSLQYKLRNSSRKLSIIRIGGSVLHQSTNVLEIDRVLTGDMNIFNFHIGTWISLTALSLPREYLAGTLFYGRICVTGGNCSDAKMKYEPCDMCEEYSFTERKWKLLKSMNYKRFGHCMCKFDESPTKLFVYGGESVRSEFTDTAEIYDPHDRKWIIAACANFKRYGSSCCTWNFDGGKLSASLFIIVVGGQCDEDESSAGINNCYQKCELFMAGKDEWLVLNDMNFDHGLFPAVWCNENEQCIYVASSCYISDEYAFEDDESKHECCLEYRVEKLDHPNGKWQIINAHGKYQCYGNDLKRVIDRATQCSVDPVRKMFGVSTRNLIHYNYNLN